jgi:hypothetical protein
MIHKVLVLSEILARKQELPLAYDFDLMAGSGHLTGRLIEDPALIDSILEGLNSLIEPTNYAQKYDLTDAESPLLFAMGDGNHSLATAKAIWEDLKPHVSPDHPSRYALVELVNLHDPSLNFEPIHRVLFNPGEDFETSLQLFFAEKLTLDSIADMPTLISEVAKSTSTQQRFGMIQPDSYILITLNHRSITSLPAVCSSSLTSISKAIPTLRSIMSTGMIRSMNWDASRQYWLLPAPHQQGLILPVGHRRWCPSAKDLLNEPCQGQALLHGMPEN